MTVYTGDVKNAGTDAELKFTLFGSDGESKEMRLDKEENRLITSHNRTSAEESTESTILKLNGFFQRKKPINFKIMDLSLSYADISNAYFKAFESYFHIFIIFFCYFI